MLSFFNLYPNNDKYNLSNPYEYAFCYKFVQKARHNNKVKIKFIHKID